MICSERVDLHVHRTDAAGGSLGVSLGECVVASKDNGTYNAKIPSERIGLREADDCEVELGSVPARFAGIDVASPPLPEGIDLPAAIDVLPRRPCDDSGAGCGPAFAEPAFAEPAFAEPAFAGPAFAEPAFAEPAFAGPAFAEPAFAGPVFAEPVFAEPAFAEPAFAEPAFTDTVNSPFDGSDLIDQLFNLND
jgi:hypothetical protein